MVQALGGEESAKKILGGIKWWQVWLFLHQRCSFETDGLQQVRGIKGVDCQWIALAKDWQEAKRRRREQGFQRQNSVSTKEKGPTTNTPEEKNPTDAQPELDYSADMDEMRCMLYFHGGGYYFGSIDQER